jgi:hypothetical protein
MEIIDMRVIYLIFYVIVYNSRLAYLICDLDWRFFSSKFTEPAFLHFITAICPPIASFPILSSTIPEVVLTKTHITTYETDKMHSYSRYPKYDRSLNYCLSQELYMRDNC